jgi:hypothetical protein
VDQNGGGDILTHELGLEILFILCSAWGLAQQGGHDVQMALIKNDIAHPTELYRHIDQLGM